jgi:ureidoglycolate lyase
MEVKMKINVKYPTKENFAEFGNVVVQSYSETPDTSSQYHNYWHDIADMTQLGNEATVGYLSVERKDREFIVEQMERHLKSLEAFIPVSGVGIFCLAPSTPGKDIPDINSIQAFWIDGTVSFFLNPGVWHWLPFAITPEIKFLLLLKKHTVATDLEIVDLPEKVNILFND